MILSLLSNLLTLLFDIFQIIVDILCFMQHFVNNSGDVFDEVVVSLVQVFVHINHLIVQLDHSCRQVLQSRFELLLQLFGTDRLVDIRLQLNFAILWRDLVVSLVRHRRIVVVFALLLLKVILFTLFSAFLHWLRLLEHHIVNVRNQSILVGIKSTLANLTKVIPFVWITRLLLGEDKHNIIFLELSLLVRIRNNVSHFLQDSFVIWSILRRVERISGRNTIPAASSILVQIYLTGSIESNWDNVSTSSKVVEEFRVFASYVIFRNFHVIKITGLNMREVRVLNLDFF